MKISRKWSTALIATALSAAEMDPRLLRLIGPDAKFVGGIDAERFAGSQLARIFPNPASLGQTPIRFMMEITNADGRTLSVAVHAAPAAGPETEASPVQYRGARIWKSDEGADAVLGSSIALHGDVTSITEAIDRWSAADSPLGATAAKASRLSGSYDVWFVGIKPLDVPDAHIDTLPLKHRAELVQAIEEVRAGIRLGAVDEGIVEVDVKSPDEAAALAVIGRYLPGMMEMGNSRNAQSAVFALADRVVSRSEGSTAVLSVSVAEFRIEEWMRQRER
jgi:hypothetical protein